MRFAIVCTSLVFGILSHTACAEPLRIAVAANFTETATRLAHGFTDGNGPEVTIVQGASGALATQIEQGAPFDVFLSADMDQPVRLEKDGYGASGTRMTYALGRLVLISADPAKIPPSAEALIRADITHIALADPVVAPYGRAAVQTLGRLGLATPLKPKLVFGRSVADAFNFCRTRAAELCFVARSQAQSLSEGLGWTVPEADHEPIVQQAIVIKATRLPQAARAFLDYLKTPRAHRIIADAGYDLPPPDVLK